MIQKVELNEDIDYEALVMQLKRENKQLKEKLSEVLLTRNKSSSTTTITESKEKEILYRKLEPFEIEL